MKNKLLVVLTCSLVVTVFAAVPVFAGEAEYSYFGKSQSLSFGKSQSLSFTDAWNMAKSTGGTIKLTQDIRLNSNMTVPEGCSITLDLNGFIIDRNMNGDQDDDGNLFTLEDGASLTVTDSDPSAYHGDLELYGGILMGGGGDDVGGCIHMEDSTTLIMEGGCILGCTTDDHGGAIRVDGDDCLVNLTDVSFIENKTEDSSDNCHGGAIYSSYNCSLKVTGCLFKNNSSEDCGGAVYLEDDSDAVFVNCEFCGNTSEDEGGAVFQDTDSAAVFENCIMHDNYAEDDGGALYVDADEITKIQGCSFYSNKTDENGAAIYINDDACYIIDSTITDNIAGEYGAVYVDAYNCVDVMGLVVIKDNKDGDGNPCNVYMTSHNYLLGAAPVVAEIYDGGLYEGSCIGLSYDGNVGEGVISESISEYQLQYFYSDSQKQGLCWGVDESQEITELMISSAIDDGYIEIIIVCLVLMAAAAAVVFIKKKTSGRASK